MEHLRRRIKLSFVLIPLATIAILLLVMKSPVHATDPELPAQVSVRLADAQGQPGPVVTVPTVKKTDAEWQAQLGQAAYEILRARGTEPAFCGNLLDNKKSGVYYCAGCGLPLFASTAKFNSGTGWPSFFRPFAKENVIEKTDSSYGMVRTEILCARCGGHLGHVFPDGPPPTGLRYCLNSASLVFKEFPSASASPSPSK